MSPEPITIREGALFISDAHESATRHGFHQLLERIDRGELTPPQLFLMGDMFDLLAPQIDETTRLFHQTITLLRRLSKKLEIHYIEGNHDFNLSALFPDIHCYPLIAQPLTARFHDRTLLLSHGDRYQGPKYLLYSLIIRNPLLLSLLNLLDRLLSYRLSRSILTTQQKKNLCKKISNFHQKIKQKIRIYDIEAGKIDFVCEGHYHQNVHYIFDEVEYINFASFACEPFLYRITFTDRIVFEAVK